MPHSLNLRRPHDAYGILGDQDDAKTKVEVLFPENATSDKLPIATLGVKEHCGRSESLWTQALAQWQHTRHAMGYQQLLSGAKRRYEDTAELVRSASLCKLGFPIGRDRTTPSLSLATDEDGFEHVCVVVLGKTWTASTLCLPELRFSGKKQKRCCSWKRQLREGQQLRPKPLSLRAKRA